MEKRLQNKVQNLKNKFMIRVQREVKKISEFGKKIHMTMMTSQILTKRSRGV